MRTKNNPSVRESPSFIEAARRAQIVECAIDVIAELGYGKASLAEIAKRAGISKSVISYYFAGKDELILEVVEKVFSEGMAFMLPQIESETTPAGKLRAYIGSNLAFMRTHRNYMVAVVEVFGGFRSKDGRPLVGPEAMMAGAEAIGAILRAGQAAGEFREFDARVMGWSIRAAIDAIPPQMAMNPGLDLDAYERELVGLFERAASGGAGNGKD